MCNKDFKNVNKENKMLTLYVTGGVLYYALIMTLWAVYD